MAPQVPPSAKDAPKWVPLRFEASVPPLLRAWRHPLVADVRFTASWPMARTRTTPNPNLTLTLTLTLTLNLALVLALT